MEEKNTLRRLMRAQIDALPADYIRTSDEGIFNNVISLREFIDAQTVFIYYSVGREPDTLQIAQAAFKMKKTVTFPLCYKGGIMQARVVTGLDELIPAMLGIPAPSESAENISPQALEFIVVPALAFDIQGFRLGYGGGYYDRFLSGLSAFKAGITRERLVEDALPREPHDIAVDCLITEELCRVITKTNGSEAIVL